MLFVYIVLLSCVKFSLTINNEIAEDFYSFVVKDIRGKDVPLEKFRGKVSLVVNVASECGYTDSHYKALKRLHDILSFHGKFNVLAFPCNQFGEQEPLENDQIEEFAVNEYGVEFPLFGKINVIGENSHPAFKYLVDHSAVQPDWNFYKYLVGPDGLVINAWDTKTNIEDIFSQVEYAVHMAENESKKNHSHILPKEDL